MTKEQPKGTAPRFKGEVLLCEDNEVNQHFIKSQLSRLGLSVVVAGDGREGVSIVQSRIDNGEKPFDLIFMDIQMPVMDGLEAAGLIIRMGVNTPMVALTANVTQEDQSVYAEHGMHRSLCKPFAAEELWACLGEYLRPVGVETLGADELLEEEEKRRRNLFSGFARRNRNSYNEICAALEAGDVKLAHRIAHTLRGLAGLMGKNELMEASRIVELALAGGDAGALDKPALEALGHELEAVLTELTPYMEDTKAVPAAELDKNAARELLDKLEPLLQGDNAASRKYADALRTIPKTGELITRLEDYEFEEALIELEKLRKALDI